MLAHVGAGVRVAAFLHCRECDFPKMDHGLTFSCFAKQLCPFISVEMQRLHPKEVAAC